MSSNRRAIRPAGAVRADLSGREPASTLAGLIDVLDRADGAVPRQRPRPAAHRPGARPAPLRSVQPAPSARPARVPAEPAPRIVVPERVRQPLGGLRGAVRRMALWGAGDQGQYLAWRSPARPVPLRGRRRAALRAFGRRMALWGAGDQGQYLAWPTATRPAPGRPALRDVDPPVVLRELPSTPSIQPVASSPAAALPPAGPVSPPFLPLRPSGPTSRTSGVPAPRSPRMPGAAGARGDPSACPVRGSPVPPRRTGPANGSFPRPFTTRAPSSRPAPIAPS